MLHCRPDVETSVCMNVPGLSVIGIDVGHYRASQGCKWAFHVFMLPVDMGICGHFWCNVALSEKVDGEFGWSHKMAPQGEGKSIVHSAEYGDKMVLEHLDSPFGDVAMRWQSGGTSLWVIPFFAMHALNSAKHLLSKW